jgi:hypothetical protein
MSAPKYVFRNGEIISRAKLAPAPVDEDRVWMTLHHFNSRLVSLEQTLAKLAAPAVKPPRSRKTAVNSDCLSLKEHHD